MAALAPPWMPEDDLLLKNAVEAGASLEALAKGAVRFSRKFTVGELRDRWRSLLYDPDVSTEASSRMVHLQLSPSFSLNNSNFPSKFLNSGTSSSGGTSKVENDRNGAVKRKVESVRRTYYAMRKKIRGHNGSSFGYFEQDCGVNLDDFGFDTNALYNEDRDFDKNCVGADGMVCMNAMRMWKTVQDVEANDVHVGMRDGDNGQALVYSRGVGSDNVEMHGEENVDCSNDAFLECDFDAISNALMNFTTADAFAFMDADGKDTVDKCSYDGLNSLLGSAPNDFVGDDKNLQMPIGAELEIVTDRSVSVNGTDQCSLSCLEANVPSSTLVPSICPAEKGDGEIECVLNTEDPDIPCNDDFVPLKHRASVKKAVLSLSKEADIPSHCLNSSGVMGAGVSPVISPRYRLAGSQIGTASPCGKSPIGLNRPGRNGLGDANQSMIVQSMATSTTIGMLKKNVLEAQSCADLVLIAEGSTSTTNIAVQEADPSTIDHDELESDDDVPSFSDIEAMILDMDLCPDDLDSLDMEASRYQNEDSKKTIMRLEQCARSSMQRSIASRGAFAVLYGHHLKHYIKETEVILGRATDDMDVDIDLGREGPANKISRRQAVIKMEADGSFLLKNLGKSLMFVNGKEVVTGQSTNLPSSSLIEIRGMAFVLEIDGKCVRHHVEKKHREKNFKFEWTEEGLP